MAKRAYKWKWTAAIKPETLPVLQVLAGAMGFVVNAPGSYEGKPSAPAFLDALAAAYERDPDTLKDCLRSAGVANEKAAGN
jgi:hypothetical protein